MAAEPEPASTAAPVVRTFAPAKLNLYLQVTGRRPDGYHLIDSLVVFVGIGDRLGAAPAPTLTLTATGRFAASLPAATDNLVLRAAAGLAAALGRDAGAALQLEKVLPVAAGIGGGSADAAAALLALSELWRSPLDAARLDAIALRLGADVPACLRSQPLQMAGIGEQLTPVAGLAPLWSVLVNPGLALATKAVFAAFDGRFSAPMPFVRLPSTAAALAAALRERRNDLEPAARTLCPIIGEVLAALAAQPGCLLARMSGSGASCFGLFAAATAAETAANSLTSARPDWWIAAAPILASRTAP